MPISTRDSLANMAVVERMQALREAGEIPEFSGKWSGISPPPGNHSFVRYRPWSCGGNVSDMTSRRMGTARKVGLLFCTLSTLAACSDDKKLQEIQKQADLRVANAQKEAANKLAIAQKQLEDLKVELQKQAEKAKADADESVRKAQEGADQGAKLAEEALAKARQAFKAEARARLTDINEDMKDVNAKAGKASAKAKAAAQKSLQEISKKETEIQKDIADFDSATLDTFRTVKAKVDQDLAKLKQAIAAARATLK